MRLRRELVLNKLQPGYMRVGSVLALAPHPDDEIIGCGGALLQHSEQRASIAFCYFTDGRYGGSQGPDCMAALRKQEAVSVASEFCGSAIHFLDREDLCLKATSATVEELGMVIAKTRPDIIYLPSPFERHPDHRETVESMRLLMELGVCGDHLRECHLHFYEVWDAVYANYCCDITQQWAKKLELIERYKSQAQFRIAELSERMARLASLRNRMAPDTYAELFLRKSCKEAIPYINYLLELSR